MTRPSGGEARTAAAPRSCRPPAGQPERHHDDDREADGEQHQRRPASGVRAEPAARRRRARGSWTGRGQQRWSCRHLIGPALGACCEAAGGRGSRVGPGWRRRRPGTTKAPPCMRWRGLAGPAALRSPIARRPPALPDCSASYLPRLLGTGTLVERVAPRGPPVPIARVQLLRGAGAPRGPLVPIARVQLLREAASRGPPVPIARVQLLREARSSRSAGPDCSGPAPTRAVAPPTLSSIARDPPARDCPTSPCPDCSGHVVAGRVSVVRPGRLLARPHLGTHHRCRRTRC